MKNEETAYAIPVSCRDCRMSTMCIPLSLRSDELYKLDQVIQRGTPYQARTLDILLRRQIHLGLRRSQRLGQVVLY